LERVPCPPRPNWEQLVQSQGLTFHQGDDRPYWDESAYYHFTAAEIDRLEAATYELDRMCLKAVEHVLENNQFHLFGIAPAFHDFIRQSWEKDEQTIYGRFDFTLAGGIPKLLEYNADTPTALIEAAVAQWFWYKDFAGEDSIYDQFNSIHERLIQAWMRVGYLNKGTLYFTSIHDEGEDYATVSYLRDTALQAGLQTAYIEIGDIGWHPARTFVDLQDKPIKNIFKLYPWEWMTQEGFGVHIAKAKTRWLEPAWKMLLSNKALLPILWQLFPDSPYLLPASFEPLEGDYVQKPLLSREGANIRIVRGGVTDVETSGPYDGPCIYQAYQPLREYDGLFPIIGSWMVNGWACGIGIREDTSRITGNQCRFVPHLFTK
jgi:glutathionylspermidine synthase